MLLDPKPWLADPAAWELPHLLQALAAAKTRVRVQLSYKAKNYDLVGVFVAIHRGRSAI